LFSARGIAASSEEALATLKGLEGVYVIAEISAPDFVKVGLSKDLLQRDVEMRLQTAGIKVLTLAEWLEAPGVPWLLVRLYGGKVEYHPLYHFSIGIQLWQNVFLERDQTVRTSAAMVDTFINAYLAANPK
jgi:hypothetical protein